MASTTARCVQATGAGGADGVSDCPMRCLSCLLPWRALLDVKQCRQRLHKTDVEPLPNVVKAYHSRLIQGSDSTQKAQDTLHPMDKSDQPVVVMVW